MKNKLKFLKRTNRLPNIIVKQLKPNLYFIGKQDETINNNNTFPFKEALFIIRLINDLQKNMIGYELDQLLNMYGCMPLKHNIIFYKNIINNEYVYIVGTEKAPIIYFYTVEDLREYIKMNYLQ